MLFRNPNTDSQSEADFRSAQLLQEITAFAAFQKRLVFTANHLGTYCSLLVSARDPHSANKKATLSSGAPFAYYLPAQFRWLR